MRRFSPVFIAACVAASVRLSAAGSAGQPGAYLRAGVGARAAALGNAATASVEGPDAGYWNPAAIAFARRPAMGSSYSILSLGRSFQSAALQLAWDPRPPREGWGFPENSRSGLGAWSVTWLGFSLGDDFEGRRTDTLSYYSFSDRQTAYLFSHGRALSRWLAVGSSIKLYNRVLESYQADGGALDLGLLLLLGPNVRVGVSAGDLFSSLQWSTGYRETIPAVWRTAVSATPWRWLGLNAQAQALEGSPLDFGFGIESALFLGLFGRIGWQTDGLCFGGGVALPLAALSIKADYAYLPDPLKQGVTQKIDLSIYF